MVWSSVQASSGRFQNSESYKLHNTSGQPVAGNVTSSAGYRLYGGYQGGVLPFSVDNNTNALTSASRVVSPSIITDASKVPPVFTSTNQAVSGQTQAITYGLAINGGMTSINDPGVMLNLSGPDAIEVMLSDRSDFEGAYWEAFSITQTWEISPSTIYTAPGKVYARYRDELGQEYGDYIAQTFFDTQAPEGTAAILDKGTASPSRGMYTATIRLDVQDNLSQITQMVISTTQGFQEFPWQPFVDTVKISYKPADTTAYIFLKDEAGNFTLYPLEITLSEGSNNIYLPLIWKD